MKKEEFFFDSRDGQSRIHVSKWIPEGRAIAVLQIIHGMEEYIDRYSDFAEFFAQKGFLVVGEDHLGHGKNITEYGGIRGYFCKQDPATVVVRDVHRLKKIVQEEYPRIPYYILGHSMGSFIARNYIIRYGSGIQGVILAGTGSVPMIKVRFSQVLLDILGLLQGEEHESRLMDKLAFGKYLDNIEKPRTSFDWLSMNEENVDSYVADPLCGFLYTVNGFKTLMNLLARMQNKKNISRIPTKLPVMLVAGELDPVGDYGKGVIRVKGELVSAGVQNVTCKLYQNMRHEIFNEKKREQVYQDLLDWLNQNV